MTIVLMRREIQAQAQREDHVKSAIHNPREKYSEETNHADTLTSRIVRK